MAFASFDMDLIPKLASEVTVIIPNCDAKKMIAHNSAILTIGMKLCHDEFVTHYEKMEVDKDEDRDMQFADRTTIALAELGDKVTKITVVLPILFSQLEEMQNDDIAMITFKLRINGSDFYAGVLNDTTDSAKGVLKKIVELNFVTPDITPFDDDANPTLKMEPRERIEYGDPKSRSLAKINKGNDHSSNQI